MISSKWTSTGIGAIALLFWSIGAVIIAAIGKLPVFEIQFIIFLSSFLLSFCRISVKRRWHVISTVPLTMWFVGVLGIYLANLFFVSAFQYAPPEKVDLINYLWPLMVILLSPFMLKEKLKPHHFMGVMLAFIGIFILLTDGKGLTGFEIEYWRGYTLSFFNALFWAIFLLFSKRYHYVPNEMLGLYAGIAALCSLVCHILFETFVCPDVRQFVLLILLGSLGQGLAYIFWDHGIKKGHYKFLCVLTYLSPILSIVLLVHFGFAEMSDYLLKSVLLVSLGAFITTPQCRDSFIWIKARLLRP